MNLPIAWVAAAGPATHLVKQTASLATDRASQLFGNLLQAAPSTPPNGPSVPDSAAQPIPKTSKTEVSWSDRLAAVRERLRSLLRNSSGHFGSEANRLIPDDYSVQVDESDLPRVLGPEPHRSNVEQMLWTDTGLVRELRSVVSDQRKADPLAPLHSVSTQNKSPVLLGFSSPDRHG
jgi:hypothetical protein